MSRPLSLPSFSVPENYSAAKSSKMEALKSPFLSPFPPAPNPKSSSKPPKSFVAVASSSNWTLSDGQPRNPPPKPYRKSRKKPLCDDDARRIIHVKAQYLRRLRRNQGSHAQTPRWIRRSPEQMEQLLNDELDGHLYGGHVVAAIKAVRALGERRDGSYDMREVMASFVAKLSFREMCTVLKEQRGWRQATDFFAWMKLQLCYRPCVIAYTILLRVYGQVGKIKLAEQLFLEMLEAGCEPDEVACGTMLCAYAKWGRHKDMLLFHSAVRRREVLPSVAVYNFMLSSLQKQKLHEQVIQLWEHMLEARVKPNGFTYTIAISSYAKESLLEEALDAFAKMKKSSFVPEEVTYNLLINLTAKNGKGDETLRLYEEMKPLGIVPSNYTYASVLTLHYKNADYSKALSLFSDMEKYNIVLDEVIYGILIRIYGKLGLYEDAQKTFIEVEKLGLLTNEKTYTAMAQVHLNAGNYDKALDLFDNMRSSGVELTEFAYSALLRCFIAKEDIGAAEITFQTLCGFGPPDAVCCNELLILYIKSGSSMKARSLIAQIRKDGVKFDNDLYRTVLGICTREGMMTEAEELIEEMEKVGLPLDRTTQMNLLVMYGKMGSLEKAEDLLKIIGQPDATSLGVMLCLYLENGNTCKSKEMLESLLDTANGLSVVSRLISKFVREGDVSKAEFIYDRSVKLGTRLDDAVSSSMITSYERSQKLRHAQGVFQSATASSRIAAAVFSSMIDAYCKCGRVDEANNLFVTMVEQGHPQDAVTISLLVNALTKHGKYQEAESIIHDNLDRTDLDIVAYNTFIKAMLDAGKLYLAVRIYNHLISLGISPSLQTYNTMISVYGRGGKLDKAVQMFNEAQNSGLSVDEKAYANMISCYGKAGRVQEASQLFSKMMEDGIRPGKITYNTMINGYATSGLDYEAENILKDMQRDGHSPDSLTYLALLKAYSGARKYSKAEEVIHRMQKDRIAPTCAHFNHLIFSFAREGCVSDSKRIYSQMKQIGLSPDLACCRTMMRMYMDHGLMKEGISFFESVNTFMKPDGFVLSAAVHLYESVGRQAEATEVLDKINLYRLVFITNLRIGLKTITT